MFTLAFLLQQGPSADDIQHMIVAMMAIIPLIILICVAIVIIPFWFICKKAGFSPWLSLLNIIPHGQSDPDLCAGLRGVEGDAVAAGA